MNTMIATSLTTILQVNMIKGDEALPDLKETVDSCKSQGELVDDGIKVQSKDEGMDSTVWIEICKAFTK